MKVKKLLLIAAFCSGLTISFGQNASEYTDGFKIKFDETGSKYLRIVNWNQFWFQDYEGSNPNDGFSIKRARVLMYSQVNDRFLLSLHFGLNSVNANNLTPMGKSDDVELFLHEAVMEYKVIPTYLNIGAGLQYWNGITRLNSSSTMNLLTLDNDRGHWSTLGLSDQFANSLGIYAKGKIGKLNYRVSLDDALKNTSDGNSSTVLAEGQEKYLGKALLGKGKYAFGGYLDYQFLDQESNLLPYRVGTYLGTKKVFNVGAGVFHHQNGLVKMQDGELIGKNVTHTAIDAFYDAPIGRSSSITAYASYQYSDMDKYISGNVVGNGGQFYAHVGYLIPKNTDDPAKKFRNRFQPYVAYSDRNFTELPEAAKELRIGTNWYIDGQNARLTVEYQKAFSQPSNNDDMVTVQAMIFL